MSRVSSPPLVLASLLVLAAPAAGHAAELTFTLLEGDPCPEDRVSCIRVTGGPGTEANIRDDTAEVVFVGVHDVNVTVENGGDFEHNLTFEPGTPMAAYSIEDTLAPGESATFNLTTVEDVPEGDYRFYCGQLGHRDSGEWGTFRVVNASSEGEGDEDAAEDVVGLPGPGLAGLLAAGLLAVRLRVGR